MMVNCPRCGFSQPKDQYCAKCGIDMLAFKAPPTPAWLKLVRHPGFQLGSLGALALVGFLFIRASNERSLAEKISAANEERASAEARAEAHAEPGDLSQRDEASVAVTAQRVPSTQDAHAASDPSKPASSMPGGVTPAQAQSAAVVPPPANARVAGSADAASAAGASAAKALAAPSNATVTIYEASHSYLASLDPKSFIDSNSVNGITYAVVSNARASLHSNSLKASDSKFQLLQLGSSSEFSLPANSTAGAFLGFKVLLQPHRNRDDSGVVFKVDVNRSIFEIASDGSLAGPVSTDLLSLDDVNLPKGSALILTNALPHEVSTQAQALYGKIKALSIMATDGFNKAPGDTLQTEAMIVIEPNEAK
jgi:hypothetical protein